VITFGKLWDQWWADMKMVADTWVAIKSGEFLEQLGEYDVLILLKSE
jgi:hypothetical protein